MSAVIRHPEGAAPVELAEGLPRIELEVVNQSLRPVRVSSHFPFWRANPRLAFDRGAADGYRLDVPSGDTVRWGPGESRRVRLVAYGRTRRDEEDSR